MKTQKIVNLINGSDNENSNFATKKWYVIDIESKGNYSQPNPSNKIFNKINRMKSLWLFWCIYFSYRKYYCHKNYCCCCRGDPQRKQPLNASTQVISKNCAPFKKYSTEIDGTLIDETHVINITMPMYNLIEYSEVYGALKEIK